MKKNSTKLSKYKQNIVIKALAEGATQSEAARRVGCCPATISQNKSLLTAAENIKKEVSEQVKNEIVKDNKDIVEGLIRVQRDCVRSLTADKIDKQSGTAIATTLAIAIDKMQLLTGGTTENIQLSTAENDKLIDFVSSFESAKGKGKGTVTQKNVVKKHENR